MRATAHVPFGYLGGEPVAEQAERIESKVDGIGKRRTFGEGSGHGLATAGDGGRMVAVASQLSVRAVSLAAKAKRRGNGNPTSAAYVLVGLAFYAVYALLGVRLVLGILAGAVDDVFVWTMVLAIAAFMMLHGILNRVHLARRYRAPDSRLWIGRLL